MTTCIQIRRPYRHPLPAQTGRVEGWAAVMDDLHAVMNVRVDCEPVGPHPVYGA